MTIIINPRPYKSDTTVLRLLPLGAAPAAGHIYVLYSTGHLTKKEVTEDPETTEVEAWGHPTFRAGKKIFAIKAFFFYGGAFHLQNDEKAHVFYTGTPQAVYIPTHKDHALLLGPKDPDGFLQTLQEFAPTTM